MLPWTNFCQGKFSKRSLYPTYELFLRLFFLAVKGKNFLERADWCVSDLNHLPSGDARSPRCFIYSNYCGYDLRDEISPTSYLVETKKIQSFPLNCWYLKRCTLQNEPFQRQSQLER